MHVLNTGSTKDAFMQSCLREICFLAALGQCEIRAKHIQGEVNRLPDYLSRWDSQAKFRSLFREATSDKNLRQIVFDEHFRLLHDW